MHKAHYYLQDEMGVQQHHDAISGTGNQAVADDYSFRLSKALDGNSKAYSDAIDYKIDQISNFRSENGWEQCARTNATYLECPIGQYAQSKDAYTMSVAVQNPSMLDLGAIRVPVPHSNYEVKVFDAQKNAFVEPKNTFFACHPDFAYD